MKVSSMANIGTYNWIEPSLQFIPQTNQSTKDLLNALEISLPSAIHSKMVEVATKKKLQNSC